MLRFEGLTLTDRLNSTQGEAEAILQDMGIFVKPVPQKLLEHLVEAGALVEVGNKLYRLSDEAVK